MTDTAAPAPAPATPAPAPAPTDAAETPATAGPRRTWRPAPRHPVAGVVIILIAIAALLAIAAAWKLPPFGAGDEVTQNAYVRGRTTVIAPQVSGYVVAVEVRDYAQVKAGQVLARIDDRIYRAKVAQAQANVDAALASLANSRQSQASRAAGVLSQSAALASAKAQLLKARADMARVDDLVRDGAVSQRERDQTLAALRAAEATVRQAGAAGEIARQDVRTVQVGRSGLEAQVEAARAQLHLAQIDLGNTVIRAPEAGQVGEVGVRLGQYVTNGTQLLQIVPADRWIIANFKETQTAKMAPGQPVSLVVDGLGDAVLKGHIERLSPAAGSEFAVLKPDNATGNFVKVPQRIGVRITVDPGQPLAARLRPGMSVEARVDTSAR
ncbi:secretion protein HlyD [Sphingomonas sp. Leaf17]|uniref:HlyD family secretion protein n=1 Tax=Sphingomonas sp. Leaf17 TaxID=1735683 RepID=UPI0006F2FF49|nr:HlyD family secretion protein [Sphingomonas sp. Leaf17]KQM64905.1 secretion protein HlyD [Sphingomonas sp. Leaf17]